MKTALTDEAVRSTLADRKVQQVLKSFMRRYERQLHADDIESACLRAVCKTICEHDNDHQSGQKFTTSLYRFCRWECLRTLRQHHRHAGKRIDVDVGDLKESGMTPYSHLRHGDRRCTDEQEGIRESLRYLPSSQRKVIYLHFFESKTMEEIARELGYSKETARTRLEKGLRRLRTIVGDIPGFADDHV